MTREFDEVLDECMDRINRGERPEDCLALYPDHAAEMEPLLTAMVDVRTPVTLTPSPQAKSAARQRFSSALDESERRRESRRLAFPTLPRWSMGVAAAAAVLLVVLISVFATRPALAPDGTDSGLIAQANFRLLISDEVNDIDHFEHLYVDITSIGVQKGNESGSWITLDPNPDPDDDGIPGLDLRPLTGDNALEIWSGNLTPGLYSKMFVYVGNVTGILVGNGNATVKLPSGKLQISKPFTVSDSVVNFVYDITVHKAGKSGKYILKPQIAASGPNQHFVDVSPKAKGKPDAAGPEAGEPDEEDQIEIEGVIESYGNGTVTANGTTVLIDDYTEIEGTLAVGAEVEITAIDTPEGLLAREIKVEPAD